MINYALFLTYIFLLKNVGVLGVHNYRFNKSTSMYFIRIVLFRNKQYSSNTRKIGLNKLPPLPLAYLK